MGARITKYIFSVLVTIASPYFIYSQDKYSICGKIGCIDGDAHHMQVYLEDTEYKTVSDSAGFFCIKQIPAGKYNIIAYADFHKVYTQAIHLQSDTSVRIMLRPENDLQIDDVIFNLRKNNFFGISKLDNFEGTAIYEGKKTEVVHLDKINANVATNNARQVFSKVSGLNIWESDAAGLQLGIGARGLSPNRTANFNVRQNGYDISADALGYPESYYTPPLEAIDKIEFVRGAATLQYGTQLGGMINFVFKQGPSDKKLQYQGNVSGGSYHFFNSFNTLGGTIGKTNYYAVYQYKTGQGFRKNSGYDSHFGYLNISRHLTPKIKLSFQYTHENYLTQQPGGMTDRDFDKDYTLSKRSRNWFKVNWDLPALHFDYQINSSTTLNWRFFSLIASRKSIGVLSNITQTDMGGNRTLISDAFFNVGSELRLLKHYKLIKRKNTFVVGLRAYKGKDIRKQGEGSNGSNANFTFQNPNNLEKFDYILPSRNYSLFAENIFKISPRLSITPGLRYEFINTQSEGYVRNMLKDLSGTVIYDKKKREQTSLSRNILLYGMGIASHLNADVELYANYTRNFRAATFSDIIVNNPNMVVDSSLSDESGYNLDLGIRGFVKEFMYFDASIYYLFYNNRIGETLLNTGQRLRTNIGTSGTKGIEIMAELDILRLIFKQKYKSSISIFINTSLNDAKYIKGTTEEFTVKYKDKKVELVPDMTLRSGITYKRKQFSASIQYSRVSEQYSDAYNTKSSPYGIIGIIPTYYVWDFSAKYNFRKYNLGISINNFTNNKYFTRRAESYPGPGIIPSDPIQFFVTLGVKL